MKKFFTLSLFAFVISFNSFAQISFTGNSSVINTPVNAPAITIDNSLAITSEVSFDAAKVSISSNFNSGDVLSYTGSLPLGVTAGYNSSTGILTFSGTATSVQYQALLRTVTFYTSSSNASQRTILFNLGSAIAYSGNNHFYEFISGSYTWTNAKAAADAKTLYGMKGYLATITSKAENDFVQQKTGADGWLGGSDDHVYVNDALGTSHTQSETEGKFYWVTGPEKGQAISTGNAPSAVTAVGGAYMNWNSGEPNNYNNTNENFIEIYSSGSFPGRWNDLPNTSTLGYVVEFGGMAGDPVVDITHSRTIDLIATSLRTTGVNNAYVLHAPSMVVDNALTIYSSSNITNATVTISAGFKTGDVLGYDLLSLPLGVSGTYNATTGVLSFTGTANYTSWQSLLRTITFHSTSNVIDDRTISFSVGNLISGSNGHFYEFVSTGANWTTAKANAAARNYMGLTGYLATITSQEENDFVQQKLSANGWIGASDDINQVSPIAGTTYGEGRWYWVTGPEKGTLISIGNNSPVQQTYMNWNGGEPNNSSTENYAQIYSTSGTAPGKWNDLNGTGSLGYVVEYGGLTTDPLLQLSASRTMVISSVLPVHDLQFSASKNSNKAELKWSTATEVNTLRFDIMRSTDGRNYIKIGQVKAAQNSGITKRYSFTDISPESINFYKLQLVDIDGRSSFSEVRQLNFEQKTFALFPNPVVNSFMVSNPFPQNATLLVKNATGAIVLKQEIAGSQASIDASHLAAGVYFAQMILEEQQSEIIKLIRK